MRADTLKGDLVARARATTTKWRPFIVILLWPVLAALLLGLAWKYVGRNLEDERARIEASALRDAASIARSYATSTTRFLKNIDQLALHVQFENELTNQTLNLTTAFERGLFTDEPLINVTIVDRNGKIVSSTHPYDRNISLAGDDLFLLHQRGAADALYRGKPALSRIFHFPTIDFSRDLRDPKGEFAGIVLISVSPTYFTDAYDVATLSRHGFLAITDNHYQVIAARSGKTEAGIGSSLVKLPPGIKVGNGAVLLPGNHFADGREKYVGWQRIDDFNVVAAAGLDKGELFSEYLFYRNNTLRYFAWGAGAMSLAALIAMYLTYRLQIKKMQVEDVRATYRLATERSQDGLYMLRPKWGADRRATDFTFIDCNRHGAELYGTSQRELLGRDLSTLLPPHVFEAEVAQLESALNQGYLEQEIEVPVGMPIQCTWIYRRIVRAQTGLAITISDISERKAHVRELERKGYEDALTGLRNRHWLSDALPAAIAQAEQEGMQVALLFVDLDRFKRVNDAMGHGIGDELLRHCAKRLAEAVRPGDKVARLGGDEFLVLLTGIDGREGAQRVADRIAASLNNKFRLPSKVLDISASIGVSLYPHDGVDAHALLHKADIAMYSAKMDGRGQCRFYDSAFDKEVQQRLHREEELAQAIEDDQFTVYYQPRLDIQRRCVCSMEALVRWNHPERGVVSPNEFIPLAEETGLIIQLGEIVIRKVFSQMAQWVQQGAELVPVSINVSARQFNETDVKAVLDDAFSHHPVEPSLIEVELTESSMTGDLAEVRSTIASIQEMGVKVLVDDFGTGYSSLAQLQHLDMDVLKVDRAFTIGIDRGAEGRILFSAIITMAHALGMRVVAEGVESGAQMDILKELDCDEIQGYFVSHPLAANALQEFLRRMQHPYSPATPLRT